MIKEIAVRTFKHIGTFALVVLFASGLFSRCANISGSLTGGPKDTLPPRVVAMDPAFNSTNIRPRRVTIGFDEFIQLKELQKEFYTSPFMPEKPIVTAKGRELLIDLKEGLDSATTYVLNLGSSVVDNNEGNPYHGLKYTFSTGPSIDSMYMSGFLSDAFTTDTVPGAYLFFFDGSRGIGPVPDSTLFNDRALAVTKTMSNGGFFHSNLKSMDYRLYAMLDNNGNEMYDPGVDEVAFLDTVYNPAHLPAFLMWYDSTLMYPVAEPQLFLRSFRENPERRQNLTSFTRSLPQQLMMKFSSKHPRIERFMIRGVDPSRILIEQTRQTNDSTLYWLNLPQEELPDTLMAEIAYQRHDSIGNLYLHEQELRFVYRRPAVRPADQKKENTEAADTLAADTVRKSLLKFSLQVDNPLIPDHHVKLRFDLPVVELHSDSITLTRVDENNREEHVDFTLEQDTMHIREYTLKTKWRDGARYDLLARPGAFRTIDGEINDSIAQTFTVAENNKLATLIVNLTDPHPGYQYILQVLDEKGTQVLRERAHLRQGADTLDYIEPGTVQLRLIEDRNCNGQWDTGVLTQRIQPEKVAVYRDKSGYSGVLTKANWEFDLDINLTDLFRERVHTPSDLDPHLGHDHAADSLAVEVEQGAIPASEATEAERDGIVISPQGRRESFELVDPEAERRAAKEAKRTARQERKGNRRAGIQPAHAHEEHDHPENE